MCPEIIRKILPNGFDVMLAETAVVLIKIVKPHFHKGIDIVDAGLFNFQRVSPLYDLICLCIHFVNTKAYRHWYAAAFLPQMFFCDLIRFLLQQAEDGCCQIIFSVIISILW